MREWVTVAIFIGGFAAVGSGAYFALGGPVNLGCSGNKSYKAIQVKVSESLVSPTSALFPDWDKVSQKAEQGCSFNVSGYLDSQNSLGVMIRTKYTGKTFKTQDGYAATVAITNAR